MDAQHEVILSGCQTDPILSYLKALGVLRLVAAQGDPEARGAWRQDTFVLRSRFDAGGLRRFFLQQYRPTPIVGPWAGRSGFFPRDNADPIDAIAGSEGGRLARYREVIEQVRHLLQTQGFETKPTKAAGDKERLLRLLRRTLPDDAVAYLDTAVVISSTSLRWPPLLGTGGNDGNFNFSLHFAMELATLGFLNEDDQLQPEAEGWLDQALFGVAAPGVPRGPIGMFDPRSAGSQQSYYGVSGESSVNPWDFLLLMEGLLVMGASAARSLCPSGSRSPFEVESMAVGNAVIVPGKIDSSHNEIWLPTWSQFARQPEVALLFREAHALVGTKPARNAVDFARAIAGRGVDAGVDIFHRTGLYVRNGLSYFCVPLGRFPALGTRWQTVLFRELDNWWGYYQSALGAQALERTRGAVRTLENALINYCRYDEKVRFGHILRAIGRCEQELSMINALKPGYLARDSRRAVPPAPILSRDWLIAAQEDTPEFRLALALASLRASESTPAMRGHLEPVAQHRAWSWQWQAGSAAAVWSPSASLVENLEAVLEHRLTTASRAGETAPLAYEYGAPLADISAFLNAKTDDTLLADWLWGLMLVNLRGAASDVRFQPAAPPPGPPLPRAYALLKLLLLPKQRFDPGVPRMLRAGDVAGACALTTRRLRASGVARPTGRRQKPEFWVSETTARRLAAALLFPVDTPSRLQSLVLPLPQRQR